MMLLRVHVPCRRHSVWCVVLLQCCNAAVLHVVPTSGTCCHNNLLPQCEGFAVLEKSVARIPLEEAQSLPACIAALFAVQGLSGVQFAGS
jgi:hypothetical protein